MARVGQRLGKLAEDQHGNEAASTQSNDAHASATRRLAGPEFSKGARSKRGAPSLAEAPSKLKALGHSLLYKIPELRPADQLRFLELNRYSSEPAVYEVSAAVSAADMRRAASVPAESPTLRRSNIQKPVASPIASPFGSIAEGTVSRSAIQDGGRSQLPHDQQQGELQAGPQADPQGECEPGKLAQKKPRCSLPDLCRGAATFVVRRWMDNKLPIRQIDFFLGVTIVGLYTLCLVLTMMIPAIMMRWRDVPPLGVVAQEYATSKF